MSKPHYASGTGRPGHNPAYRSPLPKRRIGTIIAGVLLVFVVILVRLTYVQVVDGPTYAAYGRQEVAQRVYVPALRGPIYARDGRLLAESIQRQQLIADPFLIHHPRSDASKLAPILGVQSHTLTTMMSKRTGYVILGQDIANATANKVMNLGLAGITTQPVEVRIYPAGALAQPVIGTVNWKGQGASGLEYQYNSLLSGHPGWESVSYTPDGVPLPGGNRTLSPAVNGTGLELTIDAPLQYATEEALASEIQKQRATGGTAIIMDVHTGAVLAMASLSANPRTRTVTESPVNLATDLVYEPGSVFKIVTFSASLTDGIITPNTMITIPPSLDMGGWTFHDAWSHGVIRYSATQVIAYSSNLGTILITGRLGRSRLAAQISAMGFGQPTGLHFPGASPGLVNPPSQWSASAMGSTPIGEDTGVTPMQLLDAMNTVANGGVFVPPRLVRARISPTGKLISVPRPATRRVFPQGVANELSTMRERVVMYGTGVKAGVPGYNVSGKTGTSKVSSQNGGGYVQGAYWGTFCGFVPSQDPALSACVVMDRPDQYFGGSAAAPVFSQIMQYAVRRFGIPPTPGGGITGGKYRPIDFPSTGGPNTYAYFNPVGTLRSQVSAAVAGNGARIG